MNEKQELQLCWTYNTFNQELFREIVKEKRIKLNFDIINDDIENDVKDILKRRLDSLTNNRIIDMGFEDDITSFNILKLISLVNNNGRGWFLWKETDLLEKRIETVKSYDRVRFIESLYGKDSIANVTSDDLTKRGFYSKKRWLDNDKNVREFDTTQTIKVRWHLFSSFLKYKEFTVYNGWIYTTWNELFKSVKERYRSLLDRTLKRDKEIIDDNQELKDVLLKNSIILEEFLPKQEGTVNIENIKDIKYIMALSPPCIRNMDDDISSGIQLDHDSYIVMSFYLKEFLDIDDLKEYFYRRNPNNEREYDSVSSYIHSFERLDYIFKFIYGKGMGKNYVSYKCKKIQDEVPTVCIFLRPDILNIINKIDKESLSILNDNEKNQVIEKVNHFYQRKKPCNACSVEFNLRLGMTNEKTKAIFHPIKGYFEQAHKIVEERKEEKNIN